MAMTMMVAFHMLDNNLSVSILTTSHRGRYSNCLDFLDEETRAQRGEVLCPRSHS